LHTTLCREITTFVNPPPDNDLKINLTSNIESLDPFKTIMDLPTRGRGVHTHRERPGHQSCPARPSRNRSLSRTHRVLLAAGAFMEAGGVRVNNKMANNLVATPSDVGTPADENKAALGKLGVIATDHSQGLKSTAAALDDITEEASQASGRTTPLHNIPQDGSLLEMKKEEIQIENIMGFIVF
jgi:hypothetical protein